VGLEDEELRDAQTSGKFGDYKWFRVWERTVRDLVLPFDGGFMVEIPPVSCRVADEGVWRAGWDGGLG
jgi:hypothetical protein